MICDIQKEEGGKKERKKERDSVTIYHGRLFLTRTRGRRRNAHTLLLLSSPRTTRLRRTLRTVPARARAPRAARHVTRRQDAPHAHARAYARTHGSSYRDVTLLFLQRTARVKTNNDRR